MSTLKVNAIRSTADVEMYLAKAWVCFNGTGTPAIRASGNVSSITDIGIGNFNVNFTAAMADTNYAVLGSASNSDVFWTASVGLAGTGLDGTPSLKTTSAVRVFVSAPNASNAFSAEDCEHVSVAIFR